MPTDEDFLRKLLDNPTDDTARLVYADWLDEQGDEVSKLKARFIRFELEAAGLPDESLRQVAVSSRLRKQAADLDPAWLAVVSHPALEECRLQFEFECPMKWEKLTATADRKVRFCESCRRNVHYCDTIEEAREHAWQDECVAVSLALVRRPGDVSRPLVAGMIALPLTGAIRPGRISPLSPPPAPELDQQNRTRQAISRDTRHRGRQQDRNTSAGDHANK
jgi:uncharacterized protein (TIGR02996 family)